VVAGYFFGSPAALGLPTKNVTGVARRSFAVDIWSIANQVTGAKTVSMLSKSGESMAQVRSGLLAKADDLEKMSGVRIKEMYLCNTFDEWKKQVKNCTEDLIYLADTTRIMDGDKEIPSKDLIRWTVDNANVPVVGATDAAAQDGVLFSVVTSEGVWGKQMADMVVKIINGTPVSDIPMETVKKGKLLINAKTAMEKNIEIPYEILNSADHVFE
jgi:putative ABC transport system substrate-binding protein